MIQNIFCLISFCMIAGCLGASSKSQGCSNGDIKADAVSICMCVNSDWACSYRNSSNCVSDTDTLTDGALNKEADGICLCTAGKLSCARNVSSEVIKTREKRAADLPKKGPKKECTAGETKKEGKAKCLCMKKKWKCSFGKGKACKMGPTSEKDGSIDKEGSVVCLCADGKWACTVATPTKEKMKKMKKHIEFAKKIEAQRKKDQKKGQLNKFLGKLKKLKAKEKKVSKGKSKKGSKDKKKKSGKRIKRQRDTCKFGPKTVQHGQVYEFGTDCKCNNGNFKCAKYSRFVNNKKKLSAYVLRDRGAEQESETYTREVSSENEVFSDATRISRAAKGTGDSCSFVKAGERITRRSGERFGYGMRCDCTDGKIRCITKRV